jgi:hypothetical protein
LTSPSAPAHLTVDSCFYIGDSFCGGVGIKIIKIKIEKHFVY